MIDFATIRACTKCELRQGCNGVVVSSGPVRSLIMLVGEAPGYYEDQSGRPFIGKSGDLLDRALEEADVHRQNCYVTNTVKCFPQANGKPRKPTDDEIKVCTQHLLAEIAEVKPKIIVALGATPLSFFAGDEGGKSITKRRGRFFNWKHPNGYECVVLPTYHPAYILRKPELREDFVIDLQAAKWFLTGDSKRLPRGEGERTRKPYPGTFIAGWHSGTRPYLIYRDEEGNRRLRAVDEDKHPWYFLIYEPDITAKVLPEFEVLMKRGAPYKKLWRVMVKEMRRDPECKGWIRVYPEKEVFNNWVSKEVKTALPEKESIMYTTVSPALALARAIEVIGIRTFEADLDPLRRFMTDNELTIGKPKRLWFDIETDDEAMPGASVQDVIGKVPILGIGGHDDKGENEFCLVNETGDEAGERLVLEQFVTEIIPNYDMLVAFNGDDFDFPFIKLRCQHHGIKVDWWMWILWDSLFSFRKHHTWDAESKSGYSLKNISRQILGEDEEKLDRKVSIKELWRNYREDFIEYNLRDVLAIRRIEEETRYVEVDADMSAIGNCFANNPYVSFRVDGLALIEGYKRGVHFRSKEIPFEDNEQYIGAFVLPPEKGVFENVGNFDFASLYPSVFTSWNISPDTYIPPDEAGNIDPKDIVRCPEIYVDGDKVGGVSVAQKKVGGTCFLREPTGVLPTIYRRIKVERDRCKKEMAKYPVDSPEWWQEKRHEYAFKQLGLSIYGAMGSIYSRFFNRDVAEAVTITSQYLIRTTLKLATEMGYRPLYGDTDSVFIQINPLLVDGFLSATKMLYAAIGQKHLCPVNQIELEYEQFFKRIVFLAKKRYAGWLTVQKGREVDTIEVKGLEMRRSDGAALTRRIQKQMVFGLIREGWGIDQAKEFIFKLREEVFSQKIEAKDLATVSALTKSPDRYVRRDKKTGVETPLRLPHVEIAKRLIAAGVEVYIGSKIAYVVVDGRKSPLVAVTTDEFAALGVERRYDAHYYWMNKTWPALERVLEVIWPEENWAQFDAKRERKKRLPNGGAVQQLAAPSDSLGPGAMQLLLPPAT